MIVICMFNFLWRIINSTITLKLLNLNLFIADCTEQQQPGIPGLWAFGSLGGNGNGEHPEQPVGLWVSQPVVGVYSGADAGETQLNRPYGWWHCVSSADLYWSTFSSKEFWNTMINTKVNITNNF